MIIYYYVTKNNKVGSTHADKIKQLAQGAPVYSCNINEFDGQLISKDMMPENKTTEYDQIG